MKKYGLIGYPLGHSFSKAFYDRKIRAENIPNVQYDLYPLEDIHQFPSLIGHSSELYGVNVTIPHKISVLNYLHQLSPEAQTIGAVNCIQIQRSGTADPFMIGYNTDAYGFEMSLTPLLRAHHTRALILGNGGAAKAVMYVLDKLGIAWQIVSRQPILDYNQLAYTDLNQEVIQAHTLIVNTTPLGTYPDIASCPDLPYAFLDNSHLLYDLVYNPTETLFLRRGNEAGADTKNGYHMLELQAEKNWDIWTQHTL